MVEPTSTFTGRDFVSDESLYEIFGVFIYYKVIECLLSPLDFSDAVDVQVAYVSMSCSPNI
jgi:hypothetical protein